MTSGVECPPPEAVLLPDEVGRVIAASLPKGRWRKVRAPAEDVPGNAWGARAHGKCNREQTAQAPPQGGAGKGETVR